MAPRMSEHVVGLVAHAFTGEKSNKDIQNELNSQGYRITLRTLERMRITHGLFGSVYPPSIVKKGRKQLLRMEHNQVHI